MKILIVYQEGKRGWGKRIASFIFDNCPDSWQINYQLMNPILPVIIDEPENLMPDNLPFTDLLIVLSENTGLAQLIPDFVFKAGADAVIAPVDNKNWFPRGLQNQVKEKLMTEGIDFAFPEPFCSFIAPDKSSNLIKEFCSHFGKPQVIIECKDNRLSDFTIKRDSPCGVIRDVMQKLIGSELVDLERWGGLYHQYYPCLASVELIHSSAHITETAIKKGLEKQLSQV